VESFGGNSGLYGGNTGLYGGNWEMGGLGSVSSLIGDELKIELLTVGVSGPNVGRSQHRWGAADSSRIPCRFDATSGLVIEDTGSILTGSLFDLIESVLGDWVESFGGNTGLYGGNWEVVGLGLVSSVIGDECKLEGFTVGEGECYGSLRLGRGTTVRCRCWFRSGS